MGDGKGDLRPTASALNAAAIHLLRGMRATDRLSGLTPARLSALSVVVFGGPCTLGDLARAEDVAGPTMSRIVDGLSDLGLVTRTDHPDSGRKILVVATAEGDRQMRAAAARRIEVISDALLELPPTSRDAVTAAAPALLDLVEHLRGTPPA
ncbi:DNA-binding transcriptional regulator, MarR family [Friedmanniella luteola]|uniref:DNA-binding transcriptional regulator, MarR family n=1 Tax=Friedmanniella luteola TaxID=546871 RepID=A0A1H1ZWP5_9ACTN|nr:MarR family winged helix-turn-helix transcriptional regulator [Friedmanniella luteola]SDT37987.1 DNA-binding transcriptional regulator, MarR family [Friedmanniella luteola]